MASLPASRLTVLQQDLLEAFFVREQRFVLTGGAALAGYHLRHRTTKDLDLFATPGVEIDDAVRALEAAVEAVGAAAVPVTRAGDFRRFVVTRAAERSVVDLIIDRAPKVDSDTLRFGTIAVDTIREIAANKLCTLLSRNEVRDLVDFKELLASGVSLEAALADASSKDLGVSPAAIAFSLETGPPVSGMEAPSGYDVDELIRFRDDLARQLRALAFASVPKS